MFKDDRKDDRKNHNSDQISLLKTWLLSTKSNSFEANIDIFNMYVKGGFGSSYDTKSSTVFNIAKPGIRSSFFKGNSSTHERLVEKWDTTADSVSNQAASNFLKALMPLSEKSIKLEFARLRESILNLPGDSANFILDSLSSLEKQATFDLQQLLSSKRTNFNEMIYNTVKDFLDYGNAVILTDFSINSKGEVNYFFRHLDFTNTYFWREKQKESFAVLNVRRQVEFLLKREYPAYEIGSPINLISQTQKDVYRIYITRDYVDDGIIDLTDILQKFPSRDVHNAKVFEFVLVDSTVIGFRPYIYNPISIATIGNSENQYGFGDGLSAVGGIIMANFSSGSQYLTVQKLNSSPMVVRDDTILDAAENSSPLVKGLIADSQVDSSPGGITKVGNSSQMNATLGIGDMIQPLTTPHQQLNVFIELGMNAQKIITESFKAGTMNMTAEIPNETATAASARIAQVLRNFTSRSEIFCQFILYNIIETILMSRNAAIKRGVAVLLIQNGLEDIVDQDITLEPQIIGYATEAKKQLDTIDFQAELELMGNLIQMSEALPEEEMITFKEKLKRLFS